MSDQRHPYADHPAAAVLADHQPECVTKATLPAAPVMCCCGVMVAWCDFSAHQTGMLHQAGLLPDGTPPETPTTGACDHTCGGVEALMSECAACAPPETPTTRVLAERANRRTT